jgi:hypothetical protein
MLKGWQKRFFVLKDNGVTYFTDAKMASLKGQVGRAGSKLC